MRRLLPPAKSTTFASPQRDAKDDPSAMSRRHRRVQGLALAFVVGLSGWAVSAAGTIHTASADDLTDRKDEVSKQITKSEAAAEGYSDEVNKAADALQKSQNDLDQARKTLQGAQDAVSQAKAADEAKAAELQKARSDLSRAEQKVRSNEAAQVREHRKLSVVVSRTVQQQTPMMGVATFLTNMDSGDMNARIQWSNALMAGGQQALDQLETRQIALSKARDVEKQARDRVAREKQAVEDLLERKQQAESAAGTAKQDVAAAVTANEQAKKSADAKLAGERKHQEELRAEEDQLDKRIKERIAAAKRAEEARRRAEAERRAKEAAAKAAAEKKAAKKAESTSRKSAKHSRPHRHHPKKAHKRSSGSTRKASSYFDYPVNGPITSPYGQRFHPVLHVWKLHDGTDFGASCGTPIRAPRDGVVAEKYFNRGYGNRLMLDHGKIGGHYVTTGYNHASSYTVGVGQHVSRGQVIGYVGTTGFSTGCHLHFMVWTDGNRENPMGRWF
ncbi:Glycyl-glycine endopeptidase ALE-1 precursor [Cutibacterium granulosum]|uniref:M23ase beta-sheet core domain-containing protein n=2 Tax=Cutibacterium granulosum TaxID=33011 RepID=A0A9X5LUN5_9ACTN|nr:M23 family metallopeptidase [Cutibacterium granulosum]KAG9060411.1 peptidoglycan DD-metalloendopeptidase family protein [Cutibacterium granulosum DSM 20700]SNV37183.1 Glycyl-glycine endopeptidase ALE-1 precursor [Cutibacterium granulosum]